MHGSIHRFERLPYVAPAAVRMESRIAAPVRARPLVGLIRNPRSHRNSNGARAQFNGHDAGEGNLVLQHDLITRSPHRRSELPSILAEFAAARVDYVAIDGGDGTVRDVLTSGAGAFGETWPALIVLPHGKTNALAHDLGLPRDWTLAKALEAGKAGKVEMRRPLVLSQSDNENARVSGFVLGGGIFTSSVLLGQRAHDLGAFDAAVVGLTTVWSVLQAFFGGRDNRWRRGTAMRLRDAIGQELPHAGGAPADERFLLFASTLNNLPAGIRPFGDADGPLRLAVLDSARRSLLLRLPQITTGRISEATRALGYHAIGTDSMAFEIGDRFILDGEAFPAGSYRMKAGSKLRFVVP